MKPTGLWGHIFHNYIEVWFTQLTTRGQCRHKFDEAYIWRRKRLWGHFCRFLIYHYLSSIDRMDDDCYFKKMWMPIQSRNLKQQ